MKKFDANDLYKAVTESIRDAVDKGKEVQSRYGANVGEDLEGFDAAYMSLDGAECDRRWERLTNDERNLVLAVEFHDIVEQAKAKGIGWDRLSGIVRVRPDCFGPIVDYDFPAEFAGWAMEYLGGKTESAAEARDFAMAYAR